jgi:hypothetical protein
MCCCTKCGQRPQGISPSVQRAGIQLGAGGIDAQLARATTQDNLGFAVRRHEIE